MKDAEDSFSLGVSAHSNGQAEIAEKHYRRAIELNPAHAHAMNNLGVLLDDEKRFEEAEQLYRRALSADPVYIDALNNLCANLSDAKRFAEAESVLARAIALEPDNISTLGHLGDLQSRSGRRAEAEATFRRMLALKSGHRSAIFRLALLLVDLDRFPEAEALLREALAANPDCPDSHARLAATLHKMRRIDEAQTHYRRSLALEPNQANVLANFGLLLQDANNIDEARQCFQEAIRLDPACVSAHGSLGLQHFGKCEYEEAERCFRRAIEADPESVEAWNNLGRVLEDQHRIDEAERCYRHVLLLKPERVPTTLNLGLALLKAGRYEEGWRLYESRYEESTYWGEEAPLRVKPKFAFPEWQGESLENRSLLVCPEQGFGDSLQFARYFPLLKARGLARLTVACTQPLMRLFKNIEGVDECVETDRKLDVPLHDFWCFTMSLPLRMGTTLSNIPASMPYLHAPRDTSAHWTHRVPREGFKVGLVWAGDPRPQLTSAHVIDKRRSLSAQAYLPLLRVPGITFVSLQKGATTQPQIDDLPADLRPLNFMSDVTDFADTAAIIEQLDLVITVDTSVAHLAAGLGKPVWILSRYDGCWRWLLNRDDSPWYPTVRLFRQTTPGDWSDVIERVTDALSAEASERG